MAPSRAKPPKPSKPGRRRGAGGSARRAALRGPRAVAIDWPSASIGEACNRDAHHQHTNRLFRACRAGSRAGSNDEQASTDTHRPWPAAIAGVGRALRQPFEPAQPNPTPLRIARGGPRRGTQDAHASGSGSAGEWQSIAAAVPVRTRRCSPSSAPPTTTSSKLGLATGLGGGALGPTGFGGGDTSRAARFVASPLNRPRPYASPEAATRFAANPPSRPRTYVSPKAAPRFGSPPSQPRRYTSPEAAPRFGSPPSQPRTYTSPEAAPRFGSPPSQPRRYTSPEGGARLTSSATSPRPASPEVTRRAHRAARQGSPGSWSPHHHPHQAPASPRRSPDRSRLRRPSSAPRTRHSVGSSSAVPTPATATASIWERRKNAIPTVVYGNGNSHGSAGRARARTSSPPKASTCTTPPQPQPCTYLPHPAAKLVPRSKTKLPYPRPHHAHPQRRSSSLRASDSFDRHGLSMDGMSLREGLSLGLSLGVPMSPEVLEGMVVPRGTPRGRPRAVLHSVLAIASHSHHAAAVLSDGAVTPEVAPLMEPGACSIDGCNALRVFVQDNGQCVQCNLGERARRDAASSRENNVTVGEADDGSGARGIPVTRPTARALTRPSAGTPAARAARSGSRGSGTSSSPTRASPTRASSSERRQGDARRSRTFNVPRSRLGTCVWRWWVSACVGDGGWCVGGCVGESVA